MPSSKEIAESYLLSAKATTFRKLLPFSKFAKLFPRSTSAEVIEQLYLELERLKALQFTRVAATIERDFNPLVEAAALGEANPFTDRHTLESVNESMLRLRQQVAVETASTVSAHADALEELEGVLSTLEGMKPGTAVDPAVIHCTVKELEGFEQTLLGRLG